MFSTRNAEKVKKLRRQPRVEKHSNASYVIHACVRSLARATHSSAIVDSCESRSMRVFTLFIHFRPEFAIFLQKKQRFAYKILIYGLLWPLNRLFGEVTP